MPYVSNRQRRWAHTETGTKALGGEKKVRHWDDATRGKKLPERAKTAAFVDEVLSILGEKRAAILPLLARLEFGPEIKQKIREKEESGRRVLRKLDRILSIGEQTGPSFIQKMEQF